MKLGIFVGNDKNAGAFANAMAISQAYGFSKSNCDVTIVIHSDLDEIIVGEKIDTDFQDLKIKLVKSTKPIEFLKSCEWVIWNSYRSEDAELLNELKLCGVKLTKNFPRLLSTGDGSDVNKLESRLNSFNFVAFALKSDAEIAKTLSGEQKRFSYIPRGFISQWLNFDHPNEKLKISVDGPVRPKSIPADIWNPTEVMRELTSALDIVRREFNELSVTTSRVKLPLQYSKRIPSLPMRAFYSEFFMGCNLYICAPFSRSRQSGTGFTGDGFLGVYENQVVEAQLAGAAVIGEQFTIAPELTSNWQNDRFLNFSDSESMAEAILLTLKETQGLGELIKEWAQEKHDSVKTSKNWLEHLEKLS